VNFLYNWDGDSLQENGQAHIRGYSKPEVEQIIAGLQELLAS